MDITSGMTEVQRDGKVANISAADLTATCKGSEKWGILANAPNGSSMAVLCEYWGELQPRIHIEKVPFSTLIYRLLVISAPATDFERYRGLKLQSDRDSATYDVTIIPDGLGENVPCTISQSHASAGFTEYSYKCVIKTASYAAAVELQGALVANLNRLGLIEDQAKEHGLIAKDKSDNECAPTGECTHSHTYITVMRSNKLLSIGAEPTFIRNGLGEIQMLLSTGRHNFVEGIAPDSAKVEFSVLSVRPD